MRFGLNDPVRVARLLVPERDVDSDLAETPQPRVGESGMIVDLLGDGVYLVERATADGRATWTAEFLEAELEPVERAPRSD